MDRWPKTVENHFSGAGKTCTSLWHNDIVMKAEVGRKRGCYLFGVEFFQPTVTRLHLLHVVTREQTGEKGAVMRAADSDQLSNMRVTISGHVGTAHQSTHAVRNQYDFLAGRNGRTLP